MNKKKLITICSAIILLLGLLSFSLFKPKDDVQTNRLDATVLKSLSNFLTVEDVNKVVYTFNIADSKAVSGDGINIEYIGTLDTKKEIQDVEVVNYTIKQVAKENDTTPIDNVAKGLEKDGIFSKYYDMARTKVKNMTLDEKIAQTLLVQYPSNAKDELKKYQFGGYVFFEKDFANKTETEVKNMMKELQNVAKIPILTAVDEEGGKVVRISSNPKLVQEKFKSPQELYKLGGFNAIKEDTIKKSQVLKNLGVNLNLAPVVDVSTNTSDYIYDRTLGQNADLTADYAKTVIEASKGTGVSYTLKHFPGYGNNADTHAGSVTDNRSYDDILNNDIKPFKAGINANAEAILVSHNVVTNIDPDDPASLSKQVHNILRNQLNFSGVIITDDLTMGAVSSIDNAYTKAVIAGNDLIIVSDYKKAIQDIKNGITAKTISEDDIDLMATRVIAWKYYKGMMNKEK